MSISREPWETPRPIIRGSLIEDLELKQALDRANCLAAQGEYREARAIVRVLRMTYPEYADVLMGLDEAFFEAEAERNRILYRTNHDFVMAPPAAFLAMISALAFLIGVLVIIPVWSAVWKDGLGGTYTYTTGRVSRRTVTSPVAPQVGWAAFWGCVGIVFLVEAGRLYARED
jgi:hypothetical protein